MLEPAHGRGRNCMPGSAHDGKSCDSPHRPPMPSPIGHALAGMAVGWAIADPGASPRPRAVEPAIFGAVAVAPDLDLLIGWHRMYVHSIGATLVVLLVARLTLGPG